MSGSRWRGVFFLSAVLFWPAARAWPQEFAAQGLGQDLRAGFWKYWGTTLRIGGRGLPGLRADDIPGVPRPDVPRSCQWLKGRRPLENAYGLLAEADLSAAGSNPDALIHCIIMGEEWTPDQRAVLERIEALGVSVGHLWLGSHIVVEGDGGVIHGDWKRRNASRRISSHYWGVDSQQFEISFKKHALLFGKNGRGETWFQMENHAARTVVGKPGHFVDFIRLELSKRNIGPLGSSNRTEKFPLIVPYRPAS